jgi:hypothetical protein
LRKSQVRMYVKFLIMFVALVMSRHDTTSSRKDIWAKFRYGNVPSWVQKLTRKLAALPAFTSAFMSVDFMSDEAREFAGVLFRTSWSCMQTDEKFACWRQQYPPVCTARINTFALHLQIHIGIFTRHRGWLRDTNVPFSAPRASSSGSPSCKKMEGMSSTNSVNPN